MKAKVTFGASLIFGVASSAVGQVNFSGNYFQDFNGLGQTGSAIIPGNGPHPLEGVLGSSGVVGWYGANFFGSSTSTEIRAHNGSLGSSAGRGVVFFGDDGSAERALGYLPTSNQSGGFGLVLTNISGTTYSGVDVSFVGEQWRAGGLNIPNVLTFKYGMGTSLNDAAASFVDLNFAAPNLAGGEIALNGNDPANQSLRSGTITGLNWAPGQSLVLRWDNIDLSGQDNGLAIDNLTVTGVVPAPGALAVIGLCGFARRRRRPTQ